MNWALLFKYLGLVSTILMALESLSAQIASGEQASTPGISTYIMGRHVIVTVHADPAA